MCSSFGMDSSLTRRRSIQRTSIFELKCTWHVHDISWLLWLLFTKSPPIMDWLDARSRLKAHYCRTCHFARRRQFSVYTNPQFLFKGMLSGSPKRQTRCKFKFMSCLHAEPKETRNKYGVNRLCFLLSSKLLMDFFRSRHFFYRDLL